MKTFDQLTDEQKAQAVARCTSALLDAIVEGRIQFDDKDNGDNLQTCVDAALEQVEDQLTPWFTGEAIMESCGDEIRRMAQCEAEDFSLFRVREHDTA